MSRRQYIIELMRIIHAMDKNQLCYTYNYVKTYFDINDASITSKASIKERPAVV